MKKTNDASLIQGGKLHTKTAFCHIRSDGFGIGKVSFDFGLTEGDPPKLKQSDKFWLDCAEAYSLGYKLMTGALQQAAAEAKAAGDKYRVLWQKQGGLDDKSAARQKKPVEAGKCWARVLSIVPASAKDAQVALKYEAGPGHATKEGLFVPDWWNRSNGIKPAFTVIIPLVNDASDKVGALGASLLMEAQAYKTVGHLNGAFNPPPYSRGDAGPDRADQPQAPAQESAPARQADIPEDDISEEELLVLSGPQKVNDKGWLKVAIQDLDGNRGEILVESEERLSQRKDEFNRSFRDRVPIRVTFKNWKTSKGVVKIYVG